MVSFIIWILPWQLAWLNRYESMLANAGACSFHGNFDSFQVNSGATECGVQIGNCNVKVWKSTKRKLHNMWASVKFQQNKHTAGFTADADIWCAYSLALSHSIIECWRVPIFLNILFEIVKKDLKNNNKYREYNWQDRQVLIMSHYFNLSKYSNIKKWHLKNCQCL